MNPGDSGLYNFYSPQIISDVDNDGYPDLLVSNGGDHAAPAWQTNRPPGHLMVISSLTGQLIAKAVSPDSAGIALPSFTILKIMEYNGFYMEQVGKH